MLYSAVLSSFSCVQLFATPWTVALQAPLSIGFSRQEYWGGLPCPPPGDLPDPGIKLVSLMSPALAGGSLPLVPPGKPLPTRICLVKAMVFPVVMYGCESWTIKKAEQKEWILLNCGVGEDS